MTDTTTRAWRRRLIALGVILAVPLFTLVACQGGGTTANERPIASITATPASGPAPLTVSFDGSASTDADGFIVSYQWDFGNGSSGIGVIATHTYALPGTYTARLIVTDERGATGSASATIVVGQAQSSGTIEGTIEFGASGPSTAAADRGHDGAVTVLASDRPRSDLEPARNFVPGELIVGFAPGSAAMSSGPLHAAGVRLDELRALAMAGARLYRHPDLGAEGLTALVEALVARPDVRYAHPNYILEPLATPNDEFYSFQWHYGAINLPQAWDITTGSPNVVVAVGDSGILYTAGDVTRTHPDLVGRVLPGYDFISDPQMAGDGDGRDPDPFDVGDNPGGQSSYHGTHVAGTIGAATNNQTGVAGTDWQAKLVNVRMLGRGGGTIVDIVEGALWAAGIDVPGVPTNANPAHVINLSLGGRGQCSPFEQQAFDRIASASPNRAIVVVAAGNDNLPAAQFTPASCRNVITVGATEFRNHRAPYSNYGSRIDIMAPGGDTGIDRNGDGYVDGVLSLSRDDSTGEFNYEFQQGTSMAAPHVAGVIALMKALDAQLDLTTALALLTSTARPLDAAACGRPSGSECGAGLIDAFAALGALQRGDISTPGGGALRFDPNPLDLRSAEVAQFTLTNTLSEPVSWQIDSYAERPDNPAVIPDGSIYLPDGVPTAGTLAAGGAVSLALGIDRDLLATVADGAYEIELAFLVAGTEQALTVRFVNGTVADIDLQGPMLVAAFIEDAAGELVLSGFEFAETAFSDYTLGASPGANLVVAWSDENGNAEIDAGDFVGVYPALVPVAAGARIAGIDFAIERVLSTTVAASELAAAHDLGSAWRQLEALVTD